MEHIIRILAAAVALAVFATACGSGGGAAFGVGDESTSPQATADPPSAPDDTPAVVPTAGQTPPVELETPLRTWIRGADVVTFFSGWEFELEAWALFPFTEAVTDSYPPGKFGYRVLIDWGLAWRNLTDRTYGEALSRLQTFTIVLIWEESSGFCEVSGILTSRYTIAGVDYCGWEPQQELAIDAFEGPGVTPPGEANSTERTSGIEQTNGLNGLTEEQIDLLFEAVQNPYIVGAVVDPQDEVVDGACPFETSKWGSQWMIPMLGRCG